MGAMPELPEVEALASFVGARAAGRTVVGVEVGAISAVRSVAPGPDDFVGVSVSGAGRRGKWLLLQGAEDGGEPVLAVHLARAGWLRWYDEAPPARVTIGKHPIALRVRFDDGSGFDLTEAGTHKRLAVHVARRATDIDQVASLGVEPLSAEFTPELLGGLLTSRRQQIKGLLRDQRIIAGIGNAYSDEILLVARTSPFAPTTSFDAERTAALHAAVVGVLSSAVAESSGRPAAELKDAKPRGMRVHGRAGEPCGGWDGEPCGETVREVSFADSALQYCPRCQTGGKLLADRRLSRLLR